MEPDNSKQNSENLPVLSEMTPEEMQAQVQKFTEVNERINDLYVSFKKASTVVSSGKTA